jgi:hypothetical protein
MLSLPLTQSTQELSLTLQTPHGDPIYATLHTDDGIAIVLVALASLAVAALGLYCLLAVIKTFRKKY